MAFEWPINRTGLPALPDKGDPPSAEWTKAALEHNAAAQLAVTVLHALSGRQFGLHTHTVRPCRQPLPNHHGYGPVTSYLLSWEGDRWVNWPCGCAGACRESGPNVIHLPGPVYEVTKVEIAGNELATNVWTVEGNRLFRREGPWPAQDLNAPLGAPNTWSVTYRRGIPVPDGVAELTGLLAKEFLDAINNEGRCRLPRTVTTASRQGVTYRAYDPATIYADGKTGLPEIDMWLATVNPHHILAAPTVI
ncbi:head-tail adaptor [Mycobacterium phage Saguaro]|uniref:Head-to-tail adaptor n=1 Tax=Mycobacterium phage Saguaro TaxID=2315616 RepID=A0A386K9D9_9CAUD|nr:head-tail adaptor [Mycobacterium phage Saguaro]AYD82018.1 head-to-tail adaptor [Mycobacterium phage Saguaro]